MSAQDRADAPAKCPDSIDSAKVGSIQMFLGFSSVLFVISLVVLVLLSTGHIDKIQKIASHSAAKIDLGGRRAAASAASAAVAAESAKVAALQQQLSSANTLENIAKQQALAASAQKAGMAQAASAQAKAAALKEGIAQQAALQARVAQAAAEQAAAAATPQRGWLDPRGYLGR